MIKADGINCLGFVSMRGLGGSVVSPIAVTDNFRPRFVRIRARGLILPQPP
jgi:hypothetical protein